MDETARRVRDEPDRGVCRVGGHGTTHLFDPQGRVRWRADRVTGVDLPDVLRVVARSAERVVAVRGHFRPRVAWDSVGSLPATHLREGLALARSASSDDSSAIGPETTQNALCTVSRN